MPTRAARPINRAKTPVDSRGYVCPAVGIDNSVGIAQRRINMFAVGTAVSRTCLPSSLGERRRGLGRVHGGSHMSTCGGLIISRAHNATRRVLTTRVRVIREARSITQRRVRRSAYLPPRARSTCTMWQLRGFASQPIFDLRHSGRVTRNRRGRALIP